MNPITINEELVRAIDIAYPDAGRAETMKQLEHFKTWPLITYDFGNETKEQMDARLSTTLNFFGKVFETPFQSFRYWIRTKWGTHYGVCERHDAMLRTVAVVTNNIDGKKMILKVFLNATPKPGVADWNSRAFRHDNGKEITKGPYGSQILEPTAQAALDRAVTILIVCLESISLEYLRPGNFVAKVEPTRPGKSVQWAKAREHYTVIHRTHAANDKMVVRGATVNQDPSREITRIAHTRRAHERMLKSERFRRDAQGNIRKIKIKSTWVGPEEWKDSAGQTYRIVNLQP